VGYLGYCIYGGGEKELIQQLKKMKTTYKTKTLDVIRSMRVSLNRVGHIKYLNPASCSELAILKKSGAGWIGVAIVLVLLVL